MGADVLGHDGQREHNTHHGLCSAGPVHHENAPYPAGHSGFLQRHHHTKSFNHGASVFILCSLGCFGIPLAEVFLRQLLGLLFRDITHEHEVGVLGTEEVAVIRFKHGPIDLLQRAFRGDLAIGVCSTEHRGTTHRFGDGLGILLALLHRRAGTHHRALELLSREGGLHHHIPHHRHQGLQVLLEHAREEPIVARVKVGTDGIHRPVDIGLGALAGTCREQFTEKIDVADLLPLVDGWDIEAHLDVHQRQLVILHYDHMYAIGQRAGGMFADADEWCRTRCGWNGTIELCGHQCGEKQPTQRGGAVAGPTVAAGEHAVRVGCWAWAGSEAPRDCR